MKAPKSNPPNFAVWLLRHICPGGDNEALTGDLIERFHEGQTPAWFWRQVLVAFLVGVLGEIRLRWPHFSYALAGTAAPLVVSNSVRGAGFSMHWWVLPWPWSQLILEFSPIAILASMVLPVLTAALMINGTFRWVSLFRTGLINLTLIMLGYYLHGYLNPWLTRPVPGDPYHRLYIVPEGLQLLLCFSTYLVSAWFGCPLRGRTMRAR
jgi:hypothetical protein